MKKYYGTVKICNNYYFYKQHKEKYVIDDCEICGIDFGFVRDVVSTESENTLLYEISQGIFITEKDYNHYKSFPIAIDLDSYTMYTFPTENKSRFVDSKSLEKIKVLKLFNK